MISPDTLLAGALDLASHGAIHARWWQIVLYTLVTTHVTIASVTIFLHRAQAHRALDLHPIASHFFRLWLWLGTGMVTREWVAIHRKHHAKCETPDDPHSPQTRGLTTVFLRGAELYRAESKNAGTISKFGHNTPDDWLERKLYSRFQWQGVGLLLILDVILFGAIGGTVWAVQMLWIPITAAGIINGVGHFWGYRNFESSDASRNVLPWGILIGGEELHNNHHTYPTSAKLSVRPYEFDIAWGYIRAMEIAGLARVRKTPPQLRFDRGQALVDSATLEALIAGRYDVMARYAREVQRSCASEISLARRGGAHFSQRLERLRTARRWLHRDPDKIPAHLRGDLDRVAADSRRLGKLVEMREELRQIWARTHVSNAEAMAKLQAWCDQAERSGIDFLEGLAGRLRSARLVERKSRDPSSRRDASLDGTC